MTRRPWSGSADPGGSGDSGRCPLHETRIMPGIAADRSVTAWSGKTRNTSDPAGDPAVAT